MSSRRPFAEPRGRHAAGFTLIELMIGVLIGLLASLAVTHVLVNSEGQKRSTTSGSDSQVNGALALSAMQRSVQPAGYGFAANPSVIGCTLSAQYAGAAAGLPAVLAPVIIATGAGGLPDSVRVLASGKTSYSVPLRITAPGYVPGDTRFPVASVRSVVAGDLMVASISGTTPPGASACEVFRVTANPGTVSEVARAADAGWNVGAMQNYPEGGILVNLGAPLDVTYSIANNSLMARTLSIAGALSTPDYPAAVELFPNIVQLQAFYGKDANGDGAVDLWDRSVPANNAEWRRVTAVRMAVVARSTQYEKEEVTADNLNWEVGSIAVTGSVDCGAPKRCLSIKVDHLPDYKHYRYRVFETIVPLRNMLWNS